MRSQRSAFFVLGALAAALAACNAILGIDSPEPADQGNVDGGGDGALAPDARVGGRDAGMILDGNLPDIVIGPDADAAAIPVTCANYCAILGQACTGDNARYYNADVCLQFCSMMDPGSVGRNDQNSLACRQHFAELAAAGVEQRLNCLNAGPLGDGVCGADMCDVWCNFEVPICSPKGYADVPTCLAACRQWPYFPDVPLATDDHYNTLNCRDYHLQAVYQLDAAAPDLTHCFHVVGACNADAGVPATDAATD